MTDAGTVASTLDEESDTATPEAVAGPVNVAIVGRGDKRTTVAIGPKDLAHYRGQRARTGRVLSAYHKRAEALE